MCSTDNLGAVGSSESDNRGLEGMKLLHLLLQVETSNHNLKRKSSNTMDTLQVTKNNINKLKPYQTTKRRLKIGETLYIVETNIPFTMQNKTFDIVTDKEPHHNAQFICDRDNKEFKAFPNFSNCNRWQLI